VTKIVRTSLKSQSLTLQLGTLSSQSITLDGTNSYLTITQGLFDSVLLYNLIRRISQSQEKKSRPIWPIYPGFFLPSLPDPVLAS